MKMEELLCVNCSICCPTASARYMKCHGWASGQKMARSYRALAATAKSAAFILRMSCKFNSIHEVLYLLISCTTWTYLAGHSRLRSPSWICSSLLRICSEAWLPALPKREHTQAETQA